MLLLWIVICGGGVSVENSNLASVDGDKLIDDMDMEELTVIKMEKVTSSIVKRRYFPERIFHTPSSHDLSGILLMMKTLTTDKCYHLEKNSVKCNLDHDDCDYKVVT